jgi:hypothetical protein
MHAEHMRNDEQPGGEEHGPQEDAHGQGGTQASSKLRKVAICRPDLFAAIAPATPEESTWVVLTGKPYRSAKPMVIIAIVSAEAPCAQVK